MCDSYHHNRQDLEQLASMNFDAVFDMNGRELSDTAPLADMVKDKVEHFVYMSSAGIYMKSQVMPHHEVQRNSLMRVKHDADIQHTLL